MTVQRQHPPYCTHVHLAPEGVRGEVISHRIQYGVETRHHQAIAVHIRHCFVGGFIYIQGEDQQGGVVWQEADEEDEKADGDHL